MIDWFLEIDKSLFKAINGLAGGSVGPGVSNFLDVVMWYVTNIFAKTVVSGQRQKK